MYLDILMIISTAVLLYISDKFHKRIKKLEQDKAFWRNECVKLMKYKGDRNGY